MSPGLPGGWSINSVPVLSQTDPGSQLGPPQPKGRPRGTLEEKYGTSKVKCSLDIITYKEKRRLREDEQFPWPSL